MVVVSFQLKKWGVGCRFILVDVKEKEEKLCFGEVTDAQEKKGKKT